MALRDEVLRLATNEGFDFVRVAPAEKLTRELARSRAALQAGHLDGMDWITDEWLERATDPGSFLDNAKSVVMVALSYPRSARTAAVDDGVTRGRVAGYAQGRDYHRVFEKKIRRIARLIREQYGGQARATVDYGPLLERPLATAAGMGWTGKSTMMLVPGVGPWVLLGAIATTLEIEPDRPLKKSCGSCTRCIAACPTGALSENGGLDSRLCISYHTIENRGVIPRELRPKFGGWVFGCDECLTSCPVGGGGAAGTHVDLRAKSAEDAAPALIPLLSLTEEEFRRKFRGRAITRAKRDGLVRNACVALGNTGSAEDMTVVAGALNDHSGIVRGHAAWALGQLGVRHGARALAASQLSARAESEDDPWVAEELEAALAGLGAGGEAAGHS